MEVFLYKCEVCSAVKCSEQNHGRTWYTKCAGCEGWTYYEKIVAVADTTKFLVSPNVVKFYSPTAEEYKTVEEYKKDVSQEGTEEE